MTEPSTTPETDQMTPSGHKVGGFMMSNKAYDTVKWLGQIVAPAVATLYAALAGLLGLPGTVAVVGSITAIDTFLGVIMGWSASNYNKTLADPAGTILVDTQDPENGVYLAANSEHISNLPDGSVAKFEVSKH